MKDLVFSDSDFFLTLLDAIPSPFFVVDDDVTILHMNTAAARSMGTEAENVYMKRGGEALHCIHAAETPEGCGHAAACKDCVIRNSVYEAFGGNRVYRKKTVMSRLTEKGIRNTHVLVTVSPFRFGDREFSVLILEDVTELLQLRSLLPVCAWCRKIRNDDNYWQNLEEYFSDHLDLDFSHGICEDCLKKHYNELDL